MTMTKTKKQVNKNWYFLLAVIIVGIIIITVRPDALAPTFTFFLELLKKVIPILILVFVLLIIVNRFITREKILKHLGNQSGIKGWLITIIGGIISTGPPYLWYPLLKDLKKRGVRTRFIAGFIYSRAAVKPALIPLMIFYFGLVYTIVISFVMMITSIFQGIAVEKIVEVKR